MTIKISVAAVAMTAALATPIIRYSSATESHTDIVTQQDAPPAAAATPTPAEKAAITLEEAMRGADRVHVEEGHIITHVTRDGNHRETVPKKTYVDKDGITYVFDEHDQLIATDVIPHPALLPNPLIGYASVNAEGQRMPYFFTDRIVEEGQEFMVTRQGSFVCRIRIQAALGNQALYSVIPDSWSVKHNAIENSDQIIDLQNNYWNQITDKNPRFPTLQMVNGVTIFRLDTGGKTADGDHKIMFMDIDSSLERNQRMYLYRDDQYLGEVIISRIEGTKIIGDVVPNSGHNDELTAQAGDLISTHVFE